MQKKPQIFYTLPNSKHLQTTNWLWRTGWKLSLEWIENNAWEKMKMLFTGIVSPFHCVIIFSIVAPFHCVIIFSIVSPFHCVIIFSIVSPFHCVIIFSIVSPFHCVIIFSIVSPFHCVIIFSIVSPLHCVIIFSIVSPLHCVIRSSFSTVAQTGYYSFNPFPNNKLWTLPNWKSLQQFQIWKKLQKVLQMDRKHCGKRRNCSLRAISPFLTVFSKDLYRRHVKTRACLGKGCILFSSRALENLVEWKFPWILFHKFSWMKSESSPILLGLYYINWRHKSATTFVHVLSQCHC